MNILELDHEKVLSFLPDRDLWGHKGSFGRILLLCGSKGFTGAAYMAAMGALRTGAGLTFLGVPESIYAIEAIKLNEPVVFSLPDEDGKLSFMATADILKRLPGMDAVLIGCGLGISAGTRAVVKAVLEQACCPVVLDADGITLMSEHKDILRGRSFPTILTPHEGEFIRFGGSVGADRMASAAEFAREWNVILLLKGHETCITDGTIHYRNLTGNPGMAVGGSGDVLAGMIVSLLGQGLDPLTAAACGAYLHGKAGDVCAEQLGQYGMLPTDMLNILPRLLK
ncbi:MAG: NAD(P)H-hydrate dehydratase [Oscillospiraceae bacterium]|nr:NAD(P)H-hydrate dehydratase [Oscillospiraceae bacterium]